jgi:DNA mismatch repair ATPase MutS
MSELRDILVNANQNTLVLGDELCSGTESTSAQALVSAGIQYLSEKNAKFIFATHSTMKFTALTTGNGIVLTKISGIFLG